MPNPLDALKKATGIQAAPQPSVARRALEMLTGYPADPYREPTFGDMVGQALRIAPLAGVIGNMAQWPSVARTIPFTKERPPWTKSQTTRVRDPKAMGRAVLEDVRTLPTLQGHSPHTVSALTLAQQRYPRLFGHVVEIGSHPTRKGIYARLGEQRGWGGETGLSKLSFGDDLRSGEALETVGHELAHAAQNVRDPYYFGLNYTNANELRGYTNNPYEINARKAGENFLKRVRSGKVK